MNAYGKHLHILKFEEIKTWFEYPLMVGIVLWKGPFLSLSKSQLISNPKTYYYTFLSKWHCLETSLCAPLELSSTELHRDHFQRDIIMYLLPPLYHLFKDLDYHKIRYDHNTTQGIPFKALGGIMT